MPDSCDHDVLVVGHANKNFSQGVNLTIDIMGRSRKASSKLWLLVERDSANPFAMPVENNSLVVTFSVPRLDCAVVRTAID